MNETTIVLFRQHPDGWTRALFPEDEDAHGRCTAYDSDGFRGAVFYGDALASTSLATPEQYASLKAELETMGWVLDVREQYTPEGR